MMTWLKKLLHQPMPPNPLAPWSPECSLCHVRMRWDGGIYYCVAYGHSPRNVHIDTAIKMKQKEDLGKKNREALDKRIEEKNKEKAMSVTPDLHLPIFQQVLEQAGIFVRKEEHWGRHPQANRFWASDLSGERFLEGTDLIATPVLGCDIIFSFYRNGELIDVKPQDTRTNITAMAAAERYSGDTDAIHAELERLKTENGDPCIDNDRVAAVDDPEAMHAFKYLAAHSCCGKDEHDFQGPSGRYYKLGFNYGH